MSDVVNINKSGWCALCCSNFCYCSPESLKRQVRHLLDTVKERNERIDRLEAMCEKMAEALDFYSKFTSYNETEIDGEPRIPVYWEDMSGRRARLALIEYRAMRAETKMPCPDKDIDPFG